MDHIVYIDAKSDELTRLLTGTQHMIIRGATGRKLPYGRVNPGDLLYFINNNAEGLVSARAVVKHVIQSDKLTEEASRQFVCDHQAQLQLTDEQYRRWGGKRYIVLIEIDSVESIAPFEIDKSGFGNMDDWLPVEDVEKVRKALS